MTTPNLTTWLTQADAARRLGVSREAIRQAIAARRIEWNGKTGRDCRVRGDLLPARTLPPMTRASKGPARRSGSSSEIVATPCTPNHTARTKSDSAPAATVPASAPKGSITPKSTRAPKTSDQNTPADQLLDARLRKLESDIALQTMRLESNRKEIYDQALSDFQTAYESAFAPLKKFLLSLDLPADKLRELAAIADACESDFHAQLSPR